MLETIVTSFLLVAASEMGDKTQLLALTLASRYRRPWIVMAGILTATFVAFAIWTLVPDELDEGERRDPYGPYLTTTVLFFLAEMADKTQLATVALAARFHSVALVTAGTTLGMLASDGLAVFLGDRLAARAPMKVLRAFAAGLFLVFGAVSAWAAFRR
jgi:putative Ca2+/H+ antiporter (TMEM165/GDT1 family)